MKKKPEISAHASDPDLVGSNEDSSWVVGRNCVYRDGSVADYRVSIRTPSGWKSYGHFYDLETAAYIANIAILVERCEEKYELNKDIGAKSGEELSHWRKQSRNADLERVARERYKEVQAALEALQEEERLRTQRAVEELRLKEAQRVEERKRQEELLAEKRRIKEEKTRMILGLSNPELVKFIKSISVHDPFYEIAMSEAVRRHKNLGLPRAT